MRLWSLHPRYLDARGLTALWREALLAQEVLRGKTKGYRRHPQLQRFRLRPSPLGSIARYLKGVAAEAARRGYHYSELKIGRTRDAGRMQVSRGQLKYELAHLLRKLRRRDPERFRRLRTLKIPEPHPLFKAVGGGPEAWEKFRPASASRDGAGRS